MKIRASLLAAASSLALVAGLAAPAGAAVTLNSNLATITCNSVVGTIKFAPPLTLGGTLAGSASVKTAVGGCTTDLATTVISGAAAGTLATSTNDCLGLVGPSAGTSGPLITKWKTATGSPKISPAASTLGVTQTYGSSFNDTTDDGAPGLGLANGDGRTGDRDVWGAEYGLFLIGSDAQHGGNTAPSVTGAFRGSAGTGAQSTTDATTGQSSDQLALLCLVTGIKALNFGIGGLKLDS